MSGPAAAADAPFRATGVYWPPATGMFWLEHVSTSDTRRDFDALSHLGFGVLHLDLVWTAFQPFDESVAASSMRALERALEEAASAGLTVEVSLFPVSIGSTLWLPSWTLIPGSRGPRIIVSGHQTSVMQPRDLYVDHRVRSGQVRLATEVVGEFSAHTAVSGWVLGDRFSAACGPPAPAEVDDWLHHLTDAVASRLAGKPLSHGISARDLVLSAAFDPDLLRGLGVRMQVSADWRPEWAGGPEPLWSGFLAGYATRLFGAPVTIADVSVEGPTGKVLEAIHQGGAGACIARTLFGLSRDALKVLPQEDRHRFARGLVDDRGAWSEAGAAWAELARAQPPRLPAPDWIEPIDAELWRRDPESAARERYGAFIA